MTIIGVNFIFWPFFPANNNLNARQVQLPLWKISPAQYDATLFQNVFWYMIEGYGAGKIKLGATEQDIRRLWGTPLHRSYEEPDILHYRQHGFRVDFTLRRGFVAAIKFSINHTTEEDHFLKTALGFSYQIYQEKDITTLKQKITELYPYSAKFLLDDKLIFYGRGISYFFYKNRLDAIEVYAPRTKLFH